VNKQACPKHCAPFCTQEKHADPESGNELRASLAPKLQLFPARFTKTIHFIRHGQGFHNVAGAINHDNVCARVRVVCRELRQR
jgi:hypothetical protein